MTDRDEIADAIANLTLFADLTTPQLQGVAHAFEEGCSRKGSGSSARG